MTTYGTIPTQPIPTSNLHYISDVKERIRSDLGTQRPWMEIIQLQDLSLPTSFVQLIDRIKNNAEFFRMNYIIIILFILFLGLLWHPVSLVIFIITFVAWLFLYCLRNEPLVIRDSTIDDRVVMVGLMLITTALLFITHATKNIIISSSIGSLIVLIHGALRGTEDLFFVDEDGIESAGGGGVIKMPLKNAASSSFSLS